MLAQDSGSWATGWTETRSRSYGLKEAQVQMLLNQPGPGYWCNMQAQLVSGKERAQLL
jgi:hypothetical protein